jgi:serpin B
MKHLMVFSAVLLLAQTGFCADKKKDPAPGAAERANAIAFKFYAAEAKKPGNVFFSPYSMYSAFAMVYEGARGKTAGEISSVFAFPAKAKDLRAGLGELNKGLDAAARGAEFVQANSFWAQKDYKFLPAYLKTLRGEYRADAMEADFKLETEKSRQRINAWTENKTKGKIRNLFPQGALDTLTRLVLVNAVYFKGRWAAPFSAEMTADADFTRDSGEKVKVRMMGAPGTRSADYNENDRLQALRLPYAGGGLAMLVLLPRPGVTLASLEQELTPEKLKELRSGLYTQKVKAFLPRFSFSTDYQLNRSLADMGMPEAFTERADFSGMDSSKRLYIQKAVHKAFVEVNEEGTEAAAATGVAMGLKSMVMDFTVFRADRPFLFFIEDAATGLVLFMGRMENPAAQQQP